MRRTALNRLLTTSTCILLFALLVAGRALAGATLHVPADHASIQQAINAAQSGDEIIVAAGTYNEALTIVGKAITLRSSDPEGPLATTIDAAGLNAPVIIITDIEVGQAVIEGFTITGGLVSGSGNPGGAGLRIIDSEVAVIDCIITDNHVTGASSPGGGGGARVSGASQVSFTGCQFTENTVTGGGGAGVRIGPKADVTFTECSFTGNSGSGRGGAVRVQGPAIAAFHDSSFISNATASSGFGGAVALQSEALANFHNCSFTANIATGGGRGGAISIEDAQAAINNCTFADHASGSLGGTIYGTNAVINAVNTHIAGSQGTSGGAMNLQGDSVATFTNCQIINAHSDGFGGAVHLDGSAQLTMNQCTIADCSATGDGGAFRLRIDSSLTLTDSVVQGNSVTGRGGGIHAIENAAILAIATSFIANKTTTTGGINLREGGAIFVADSATLEAANCVFHENSSVSQAGAIAIWQQNVVKLTGCTFTNNTAVNTAGAIRMNASGSSQLEVIGCTFAGNTLAGTGAPALVINAGGTALVENCVFDGNSSATGNGAMRISATSQAAVTTVRGCTFTNNFGGGTHTFTGGGALLISGGGSGHRVEHCHFEGNSTDGYGGGMNLYETNAIVTHCTFIGNTAALNGGGIRSSGGGGTARIWNGLFVGNHADGDGGGIYLTYATARNCTLVGNSSSGEGGGIRIANFGNPSVHNTIAKSNINGDIWTNSSSTITISHSNASIISSGSGWTDGGGNINEDPLFVDPDIGNFRLDEKSPSIDTGSNVHVPLELTVDLDGNPRIVDATNLGEAVVDMGAYEFPIKTPKPDCPGDLTSNGSVGVPDLLALLAAWGPCDDPSNCPADLTGNGSVGVPDLLALLAAWGPCP